jgi:hyperosmotically inducible protein
MNKLSHIIVLPLLFTFPLSGCLLAAGAVGAEAGYVATQDDRSAAQTIDDQVILASIKTKYLADPDVSALKINIDVFKGEVTLRGYVKSNVEIDKAIDIAKKTNGVKLVDSRLILDS